MPTVTVSPGAEATTTLTVRNDGDIVEAYTLDVVGDCAAWTTVEPARVSLYPGTSETVTVRFAPPRSHEVRAGEKPVGIRVLPAEHPESVAVPEMTVVVEPFHELRARLEPGRRRGWLGARFRTVVQNLGNAPTEVALAARQPGEELRLAFTPERRKLEPGESAEAGLKVRARKLIWFGAPAAWPFEVVAGEPEDAGAEGPRTGRPEPLQGEFAQLPLFPKWLLILLAAVLALLLAWFALVRPAVRSTAKEAGAKAAQEENRQPRQGGSASGGGQQDPQGKGEGSGGADGSGGATGGSGSTGGSGGSGGSGGGGGGRQSSETIDVQTAAGGRNAGTYVVPEGQTFGVTDIVVANFQGDEGLLTISFGQRKITTIALETFRNQDYHWVTPIQIPEKAAVTVSVTCSKPGTPATGKQASGCHQVLNVSGVLSDVSREER
ncbi:hydrolytic protein [Streptomyces sp. NPDC052299]|uniref:COG1470 family protein n=1 Tax=Streptomyces sp. NPDC052299 TaxID=3155054 RepID=UPI003429A71D